VQDLREIFRQSVKIGWPLIESSPKPKLRVHLKKDDQGEERREASPAEASERIFLPERAASRAAL